MAPRRPLKRLTAPVPRGTHTVVARHVTPALVPRILGAVLRLSARARPAPIGAVARATAPNSSGPKGARAAADASCR